MGKDSKTKNSSYTSFSIVHDIDLWKSTEKYTEFFNKTIPYCKVLKRTEKWLLNFKIYLLNIYYLLLRVKEYKEKEL